MLAFFGKDSVRDVQFQKLLGPFESPFEVFYCRLSDDIAASPSASLPVIEERLDLVSLFLHNYYLRETVVQLLQRSFDSQRLVQKFSLARGDADDLMSLSRTIEVTEQIFETLSQYCQDNAISNEGEPAQSTYLKSILSRLSLTGPRALANRIRDAIDEEGLLESERIKENEEVEMVALAQDVLAEEGSPEDLEALPKQTRRRVAAKKVNGNSNRDIEDENIWIMRQRFRTTLVSVSSN